MSRCAASGDAGGQRPRQCISEAFFAGVGDCGMQAKLGRFTPLAGLGVRIGLVDVGFLWHIAGAVVGPYLGIDAFVPEQTTPFELLCFQMGTLRFELVQKLRNF